mmetsp:Transcript_8159/g.15356  ORF Transcript_8159/g.15356 Transcript_8159/m.15356 type:complete len:238 (-) Transcript_8159:74-787(-)
MAITSRTAKGRADPAQNIIEADTDPLFRFMDFVFTEDEMGMSPSNKHPAFLFDSLPSPTPLADIIQNDGACTNDSRAKEDLDRNIIADQSLGIVSTDVTVAKRAYRTGVLPTTATARPEDVLSVRGMGHSKNPGNLKFRQLVNSKKRAYERNSCPDFRRSLAEDIVAELLPGRFLKKSDAYQHFYQIMDYEASVTKALFAIRDLKTPMKKFSSDSYADDLFSTPAKKRKRKRLSTSS